MEKLFVKRWLVLGFIFVFDGIVAMRTSIPFFIVLFWFFLVSVLINAVFTWISWSGAQVTVKHKHAARLDEGDVLRIETEIENTGNIPACNIILEDSLTYGSSMRRLQKAAIDYLPSGYPIVVRSEYVCEVRGEYTLGPSTIYFSDFFGLFVFKKVLSTTSSVYVYPRMFAIHAFPPLMKGTAPWFGIGATRSSGGDDEFFGIRDYRPQDPMKSIHWISTARKNKLIVKEFQQQNFYRATLVFNLSQDSNLGEGNETVAEYIIRIAASVSKYFLENDIAVEIIAHTGEIVHIPSNKGPEHLEEILKFLTVAQPESNVSIGEIFREFMQYISDDANLIVIMLDRDWEAFLAHAAAGRPNVSLLPLILLASSFVTGYQRTETLVKAKVRFAEQRDMKTLVFSAGEDPEHNFSG